MPKCWLPNFPCTYLGLLLGVRKSLVAQFQVQVDKVGQKLVSWRAPMLTNGGRLTAVKLTLCAIPVYAMLSLDIPVKVIANIDSLSWVSLERNKICWRWSLSCGLAGSLHSPKDWWSWLQHTEPWRPWQDLSLQLPKLSSVIFEAATNASIKNSHNTLFWLDPYQNQRAWS